jgi:hypothetical protein
VSTVAVVNDLVRTLSFVKVKVARICHNTGDTLKQMAHVAMTYGAGGGEVIKVDKYGEKLMEVGETHSRRKR